MKTETKVLPDEPVYLNNRGKVVRKKRLHTCQKCGYVWESFLKRPKKCPGCQRWAWDSPWRV